MKVNRGDLRTAALPVAAPQDWSDPAAAVQTLYDRAEAKAIETIDWYLGTKRYKKRVSRYLRAAAIVLGSAGAIEPVVIAPWLGPGNAQWGYVLLGAAAACVAFDRFFGISTGWMRCIQSSQTIQAMLEGFQYDWAAINAVDPDGRAHIAERLALLRSFTERVTQVVQGETDSWVSEFSTTLAQLDTQTSHRTHGSPSPDEHRHGARSPSVS